MPRPPTIPYPPYPRFPARPTPEAVVALFTQQRAADPVGVRLHTFVACAALFLAGWPTTYVEFSGLAIIVVAVVRLWSHHRVLGPLFWDPIARLTLAWTVWVLLSMAWTPGGFQHWVTDGRSLRFAAMIPLLYPVLDRWRSLVFSLGLGLICGELSQLAHALTVWFGTPNLLYHRDPARLTGWWDPVVAGSLLAAALGLLCGVGVLADAHFKRPLQRAAVVLCPFTLLALLATGTRGAWIAGAVLLLVVGAMLIVRSGRGQRRAVLLAALACVILSGAGWLALPGLRARAHTGIHEVRAALSDRDYTTFTGLRIAMWMWSWDAFKAHPVRGVGAGGLRPWAAEQTPLIEADRGAGTPVRPLPHAHAHSWPLHTLATLGLVGFALMAGILIAAWRSTLRHAPAVALALLGLMLAGLFDTIHVNQQTANMLFILLALSVPTRPAIPTIPAP